MDVDFLLQTLASTLVPSREEFKQAERTLGVLEKQTGFAPALLSIVFAEEVPLGVRQAAAVYFKNKVTRSWSTASVDPLPDADKAFLKANIVSSIVRAPPPLREFFVVCLSSMLSQEYRNEGWPELLPQVMELLRNTNNLPGVVAGLVVLKQICKFYRWQNFTVNKQLSPLMAEVFPYILQISEAAIQALHNGDEREVYYQLVYEVLKIYKLATSRVLPAVVRETEIAKRTISMFVNVFMLQPKDLPYAEKCTKWAARNIATTYTTYLTKSYIKLSDNGAQYKPYRDLFVQLFCPEITKLYIQQLQLWSADQRRLSDSCLSSVLIFLTAMIDVKQVYVNLISPQLNILIAQILFRMLSPTEADIDLFEDDPTEFILKNMNHSDYIQTPSTSASSFVQRLVRKRPETLPLMLSFLEQNAQALSTQPDKIAAKVGVLNLLQALSPLLMKGDQSASLEPFVSKYVLPDLLSPNPFLRTAVCETIIKISELNYTYRETLLVLFNGLLDSFMNSKCLPLQVSAALALRAVSIAPHNLDIRAALGDHISGIVSMLLVLTEKVDSESLLSVLDHFVDLYPDQITPFAIDLATHLCTQFQTLASEIAEQTDPANLGSIEGDLMVQTEEKVSSGLSIMNSLGNLQSALEHRPDLTAQLDEVIAPIFTQVYVQKIADFYADCLTMHENTLFPMKSIPERHWAYFDMLTKMLEIGEVDYFEEAMPVLENYILYGSQALAANPARLGAFTQLLVMLYAPQEQERQDTNAEKHMLAAVYSEAYTRGHVMSLLVKLLTCNELVKGPMIPYIPQIVQVVSQRVHVDAQSGISVPARYNVALVSVVLACFFNEPTVTMSVLDQSQSTASFFEMWFQTLPEFVRVTDFKLSEMAILSLLVACSDNETVQANIKQLLHVLCECFTKLPIAVQKIREMLNAEESAWNDDNFDDSFYLEEEDDDDNIQPSELAGAGNETGDGNFIYENPGGSQSAHETQDVTNDSQDQDQEHDQSEFDSSSHMGMFFADNYDEHLYAMNPLDKLNPYNALRIAWGSMSPERQQRLLANMSPEDQQVLDTALKTEALVDPKAA